MNCNGSRAPQVRFVWDGTEDEDGYAEEMELRFYIPVVPRIADSIVLVAEYKEEGYELTVRGRVEEVNWEINSGIKHSTHDSAYITVHLRDATEEKSPL